NARNLEVFTSFEDVATRVDAHHKTIMADHGEGGPARYVLITDGDRRCLSIHCRATRKRVRFSIPIYLSDRDLFRRWIGRFLAAYRSIDGSWATLCQPRFLARPPLVALKLREPRPQMFKSRTVPPDQITALYSEILR
ncbi:hypothetical protein ABTU92_30375, partial [Rhodoplanes sp. SY1]